MVALLIRFNKFFFIDLSIKMVKKKRMSSGAAEVDCSVIMRGFLFELVNE